ncbi:uncharacterized protein METZ01_LOCUS356625 [marine metagenome]|uniref:Uncharacterized protein n=1 Tax=marine metagenome TaxID=408172 RepID=A0A382S4F7_9ZZZZ
MLNIEDFSYPKGLHLLKRWQFSFVNQVIPEVILPESQ